MRTPELVLLGGPNSGKTHFGGQLYGRVQRRPGALRIRRDQGPPPDLTPFEEVLHCLENGRAASHTSIQTWAEVALPLVSESGRALDLRWPDYGGEQLNLVFQERAVPEPWRGRLVSAEGWVLLIRIGSEVTYRDALDDLVRRAGERMREGVRAVTWDANARWVELLQLLLHAAELGTVQRLGRPRLAVLLSCYDELDAGERPPSEVLAERLPLVSSFVTSNWEPESRTVWGLSALGRLLEPNSSDEAFIDQGPEFQGWVVPPDGGPPQRDLCRPISWLLDAT